VEDLKRGDGLRHGDEPGTGHAGRYLLALILAVLLALGAAMPVFAAEEPAGEDEAIFQPQVVGGEPVPDGKYPFMVSIQADTSNARPYREHFCGGTLIDPDSVLTAAHCADEIGAANTPATVSFRDIHLAIGVTELNTRQGVARGISRLADVRIHPLFDERTRKYDAAVIQLDAPVNLNPIASAPEEEGDILERPRTNGVVAGWGNTIKQGAELSQRDRFPERLQRGTPRSSRIAKPRGPTVGCTSAPSWSPPARPGKTLARAIPAARCGSGPRPGSVRSV
jgi:hypothetical protein